MSDKKKKHKRKKKNSEQSLAEANPIIAKQWHPEKNGDLTPEDVTCGSTKKVWWYLPYDDPETGKHFEFEWEATIFSRTGGNGCPYLSGKAVCKGYNDLATKNPQLAAQWHPEKNGELTPEMVTPKSHKKVWWQYPYDDPETGKHFKFEWEAPICKRSRHDGCPFISGRLVWQGYNDLATKNPQLAAQWHPEKNGDLTPEDVTCGSAKKVWWYLPYDDPETGKHFEFEWEASVHNRNANEGCPFLTGKLVCKGYNDLATKNPQLAAQWHPEKNGELTPEMVTPTSNKKVWWQYPYDDPETGKHFEFEWEASVAARTKGNGCPFLSGRLVWKGYNDLATKNPQIAAEWHPEKNGDLTPEMVTPSSERKVWWKYAYDDPETGRHYDFEWEAAVHNRTNGDGCPFLSGKLVLRGYNDLATKNPKLAAEWHPEKNGDLTPEMVTPSSGKKVWWQYTYDDPETGKHFVFEWEARIGHRNDCSDCPFLSGRLVWKGYNDLATNNPQLAAQWHPEKNGDLTPEMVTPSSGRKVWWKYAYDDPETGRHFDFEWRASIGKRSRGDGCPFLSGRLVWKGYNDLETKNPDLAQRWHPYKNRVKRPCQYTVNSPTKVWWICLFCGHEWRAAIGSRNLGSVCKNCGKW